MDHEFPGEDLAEVMKKVVNLAKADGEITDQEYNLLERLSFDVATYLVELEESRADGVIDEGERAELMRLKEKILVNAKNIAQEDGIVDRDEQQMLEKLLEILGA